MKGTFLPGSPRSRAAQRRRGARPQQRPPPLDAFPPGPPSPRWLLSLSQARGHPKSHSQGWGRRDPSWPSPKPCAGKAAAPVRGRALPSGAALMRAAPAAYRPRSPSLISLGCCTSAEMPSCQPRGALPVGLPCTPRRWLGDPGNSSAPAAASHPVPAAGTGPRSPRSKVGAPGAPRHVPSTGHVCAAALLRPDENN